MLAACTVAAGLMAGAGAARPAPDAVTRPRPTATSPALDVLPFPGTPDATPQTQIHFPALTPSELTDIAVTASRSGPHPGRISAVADNGGAVFVPREPFVNGDRVTVRATLGSPAAGTATGDPGATRISFSFAVVAPVGLRGAPSASTASVARASPIGGQTRKYHSEPWLHPPIFYQSGRLPDPGQGDLFLDAQDSTQNGPLILSPRGQVVWFSPLPTRRLATNVEVQQYQGQSVLTYWEGYVVNGYGIGHDVILNHSYQTVATIKAGDGLFADLHEFQVTPQGDAFITAYEPILQDLRRIGGSKYGVLVDSVIQEINIATGQLLWEWHAYGHVRLSASYASTVHSPYDFFHVNSIEQLPDGNLIVSARHTWSVYEINIKTGRIMWELGGKHSNFRMGSGTNFEWQHDAHLNGDVLTVFDNGDGYAQAESQSRALRIRINPSRHRATLVNSYTNNPPLLADSGGSLQMLPDGNTFVGWGSRSWLSEFGKRGRVRYTAHFGYPIQSYRAYRFQWYGQPDTSPDVVASATGSGTTVYASWDGATDVTDWLVLAGPNSNPSSLTAVTQTPPTSFETSISADTTEPYIEVEALGSSGQVLGTSAVVDR